MMPRRGRSGLTRRAAQLVVGGVLLIGPQVGGAQAAPPAQPSQSGAQPTPQVAPQQASPMQEGVRLHARLAQRTLTGVTVPIALPSGGRGELYIPKSGARRSSIDLLVHFHGAAWLARQAAEETGKLMAVASFTLGNGSGVYDRTFRQPGMMDSLMTRIQQALDSVSGQRVTVGRLALSGFSAGHGAIRVILRDSLWMQRVHGVLLLDGMHTSYVPEGTPVASGGILDSLNLLTLTQFAARAAHGAKRMVVTHSEIFPGTYASTTETAMWMLQYLGLRARPVLAWGPRGMQQLSEAKRGGLLVQGFAGTSAPDHIDHLHAMPEMLKRLMR
ncbi:MAG: hypothetical protein IBJ03_02915 [Gemmatimonadaceae bacterium]|nr:hypothetical protein [Gemmatimonadaceae bacterium]